MDCNTASLTEGAKGFIGINTTLQVGVPKMATETVSKGQEIIDGGQKPPLYDLAESINGSKKDSGSNHCASGKAK